MNSNARTVLLALLIALSPFRPAHSAPVCLTNVPAGPVANQTWTAAGSPYCVNGDISVSLLTIEPGVTVCMTGPYKIDVLTTIIANGTAVNPIVFTSQDPGSFRWKGIKFQNTFGVSTLERCVIEYSDDAGIEIVDSEVRLRNSTLARNASTNPGGGITATIGSYDLVIEGCTITEDSSRTHGGGIHAAMTNGRTLRMVDCTVSNNISNPRQANGDYTGGGINVAGPGGRVVLENCLVTGNTAISRCASTFACGVTGRGGAIHVAGCSAVLENCVITDNLVTPINAGDPFFGGSTYGYGAGMYFTTTAGDSLAMRNCIVSCNTGYRDQVGPRGWGNGVFVNAGSARIVNCTFSRNGSLTTNQTDAVYAASGTQVQIKNSILYWNNPLTTNPDTYGLQIAGVGSVTVTYSDIQNGYAGTGNLNFSPAFAGGAGGCAPEDHLLLMGSPCIDSGDPDPQYNDSCFTGDVFSKGGVRNDMGAFGGKGSCRYGPPTPVLLSLVSVDVTADRIRLTWWTGGIESALATVYRCVAGDEWSRIGVVSADGMGYLRYADPIDAGVSRVGYRLGIVDGGVEGFYGETWVDLTALGGETSLEFALDPVRPNPLSGSALTVRFTLPSADPAEVGLFDTAGRLVAKHEVGSFGAGHHTLDLGQGARLSPGLYLVCLRQGATKRVTRVAVVD